MPGMEYRLEQVEGVEDGGRLFVRGPNVMSGYLNSDTNAKFKELNERLMSDTQKLLVAAKAGNLDALKAAMDPLGETCKTCHDTFRKK